MKKVPMVYLDLDGVLADLERGIKARYPGTDMTDKKLLFNKLLPAYVEEEGFFHSPVMDKAIELVSQLVALMNRGKISLSILTSAGDFYHPISRVVDQKKRWLEVFFPDLKTVPFTATTCGADKSLFAHENALLIDDHYKNVDHFINAGGFGFVYTPDKINEALGLVEEIIGLRG
jgi:hypothetical protein